MLSTSKGYPTKFVDSTQNHDKMFGIPNQKYQILQKQK
jgi:hypothetical protein